MTATKQADSRGGVAPPLDGCTQRSQRSGDGFEGGNTGPRAKGLSRGALSVGAPSSKHEGSRSTPSLRQRGLGWMRRATFRCFKEKSTTQTPEDGCWRCICLELHLPGWRRRRRGEWGHAGCPCLGMFGLSFESRPITTDHDRLRTAAASFGPHHQKRQGGGWVSPPQPAGRRWSPPFLQSPPLSPLPSVAMTDTNPLQRGSQQRILL